MAAHARLKNEFTEDEKCHNLMGWLKLHLVSDNTLQNLLSQIFDIIHSHVVLHSGSDCIFVIL